MPLEQVRQFISENDLIHPGDRVLAAVSGGADSTALLLLLNQLRNEIPFSLSACHLNHQLRAGDSENDQLFVENLCKTLDIELYTESINVRELHQKRSESLEETARNVRYDFFERSAKHFQSNVIALGHHKDDQTETVLFNLFRGSSFHGLRGIPVTRPLRPKSSIQIIRPLLCLSKKELEDWLMEKGIAWRVDRTNLENHATRNILRNRILPELKKAFPSISDHLLALSKTASDIEKLLKQQTDPIYNFVQKTESTVKIDSEKLKSIPEFLSTEVVRRMLMHLNAPLGDYSSQHFRNLVNLEKTQDFPGKLRASVQNGFLVIEKNNHQEKHPDLPETEVRFGTTTFGKLIFTVTAEPFDPDEFKNFCKTKTFYEEIFDETKVKGNLRVRISRDGDRFWPLGSSGHKSVGDFLTDVKAGMNARPTTVVTDDEKIIWVVGRRIDERVRVDATTQTILKISVSND
jgi:tRNA(Ile)-lysidine synthase